MPVGVNDDGIRSWAARLVSSTMEVWLAEGSERVVGLLVLDDDWVDQLYVEPALTGHGIGSTLLDVAKRERATGLRLWTFASNTGARRFYERHEFAARDRTDGDNEEGAPDILYVWDGHRDG